MKRAKNRLVSALAATLLLGTAVSQHAVAENQSFKSDADLQAEVMNKALNKPNLKGVQVTAHDGVVALTGTVDRFYLKEEADKRARKIKGMKAMSDEIQVASGTIPDPVLEQKLVKAISYDRVGYGTTAFNAISVSVNNGDVTLSGHAYGPADASSAFVLAASSPGVKNVINEIKIDPASPMDDRTRIQVYRTVYGFSMLSKYAMDPAKPIRISVQNGDVTLYGVVNNQTDKDVAGLRANTVPGVFKVTNELRVAGATERN